MRARGTTIWITGLPASGKSVLAEGLRKALEARKYPAEVLDGEEARARFSPDLGYSPVDRALHIARLAVEARRITAAGSIAIVSAISPYRAAREAARQSIGGRFIEVYVECPLEVCRRRDPKGLYKKALAGEMTQVTGVDAPYEAPESAEVVVRSDKLAPAQEVAAVLKAFDGEK